MGVLVFYLFLVLVLLTGSVFSVEAWPFSAYPMFSAKYENKTSTVFYLEIEQRSGKRSRWRPKRFLFRKRIDSMLKVKINNVNQHSDELKNTVAHFYKLYCAENKKVKNVVAVYVMIHKSTPFNPNGNQTLFKAYTIDTLNSLEVI